MSVGPDMLAGPVSTPEKTLMPGSGQAFDRAERCAPEGTPGSVPVPVDASSAPMPTLRSEWPTWAVVVGVYGGWLALTFHAASLPWWVLLAAGGWLTAWHGSLQHEAIHGYPTRSPRMNAALAWFPLGLWMPYAIYRETHVEHHEVARLTDPATDPESFHVSEPDWARMGRLRRAVYMVNQTLAGRLCAGPALIAGRFWIEEARRLLRGDFAHGRTWAGHVVGVALVFAWTVGVCELSAAAYVALFAYPGLSLTLLRSFAEHEPSDEEGRRTVIVESGRLGSLLYLNNNLHAVHHAFPGLAWHAIRDARRARPDLFSGPDGPPHHRGYAAIARRFLFRPRAHPVHPG